MSEVYNPESNKFAELESLELKARKMAKKRNEAETDSDRAIHEKQLKEIEAQIAILKKQLRP